MNAADSRTACSGAYTRVMSTYSADNCAKRLHDTELTARKEHDGAAPVSARVQAGPFRNRFFRLEHMFMLPEEH